ncbi:CoA transferase [Kutzneria sp. CA-103260]|uniref:CoA transferase n=1 Tax=Kutzneria sp. CA-103260 TaxID=2802641 RepID=UPI001BAA7707|nr:CoA transferase [Kutzneria sp. CA-103260]QUQ72023.1 L-carnitine dehydratase/bile acid-inducible protein F [Kutzneria sp. CA-103260]
MLDLTGVTVTGSDPVLPGRFKVGELAATCVGATTLAAAGLLRERSGVDSAVAVDVRAAAVAFRSERHLRVNGLVSGDMSPLSGDYEAADGWVRLQCNYPHLRRAAVDALGALDSRESVAERIRSLAAVDVESLVQQGGGAAGALRAREQWLAHPQARLLERLPVVQLERFADAPTVVLPSAARPLSGVRVLDLTHVIAGPVCGRTLAAHGADVLHVAAAHRPVMAATLRDTSFGKRSCWLDLRIAEDRRRLRELVAEADVFVQSYRHGALARHGFGPEELAALRPGIIAVDVSAYGTTGPWGGRRGFDSLVQMVSGIADDNGTPRSLPAQALDHGSGWLAAWGVITALRRRAVDGGSWRVSVSLARTGLWLDSLGRTAIPGSEPEVSDLLTTTGEFTHVKVPGTLSAAPPYWSHGPRTPGGDPAAWW